jgi:hypothetical protein
MLENGDSEAVTEESTVENNPSSPLPKTEDSANDKEDDGPTEDDLLKEDNEVEDSVQPVEVGQFHILYCVTKIRHHICRLSDEDAILKDDEEEEEDFLNQESDFVLDVAEYVLIIFLLNNGF